MNIKRAFLKQLVFAAAVCAFSACVYGENVLVIVNNDLGPLIQFSINRYLDDVRAQGLTCKVVNWRLEGTTPQDLRSYIISEWPNSLKGVVLVGDLPIAHFEVPNDHDEYGYANWPCDYYFADLNGQWLDSDGNGIFDTVNGDRAAEIWVGRMRASNMDISGTEVGLISNYFLKNHEYRMNYLGLIKQGLLYADDDWQNLPDIQSITLAFNNVVFVTEPSVTNAEDYKNKLRGNFEWIHAYIHSSPTRHAFGSGGTGSEGYVTNADIRELDPMALFYNLYACSPARYTTSNCLANTYLFSRTYGLLVIASTKVGSIQNNQSLYLHLHEGDGIGEAFKACFNDVGSNDMYDYWGMILAGDPTLTVRFNETGWLEPEVSWLSDGRSRDPNSGYHQIVRFKNYRSHQYSNQYFCDAIYVNGGNWDSGWQFDDWAQNPENPTEYTFNDVPDGDIRCYSRWRWQFSNGPMNYSDWAGPVTLNIDCTPPEAPSLQMPANQEQIFSTRSPVPILFTWMNPLDSNGISKIALQLHCAETNDTTTAYFLSGETHAERDLLPGHYTWKMRAWDDAPGLDTVIANGEPTDHNYSSWSASRGFVVVLDNEPPTGSITINGGAAATASDEITLSLPATDNLSGVTQMILWNDLDPVPDRYWDYIAERDWFLSNIDGTRRVWCRFRDGAGNLSAIYSDTIILDRTGPTGGISINDGLPYTLTREVLLALPAYDRCPVTEMMLKNEGEPWRGPIPYAMLIDWLLIPGDGLKTVYVKYKDSLENWGDEYNDTIILKQNTPPTYGPITPPAPSPYGVRGIGR